jgi:hypothetical protein
MVSHSATVSPARQRGRATRRGRPWLATRSGVWQRSVTQFAEMARP